MIPPPPASLAVLATARETRILLDHGRPAHLLGRVRRGVVVGRAAALLLAILVSTKLCWVGALATVGLAAVTALDLARVVMAEVVLRRDGILLVHRRWSGLAPRLVPWGALRDVGLSSHHDDHRGRDSVRIAWDDAGEVRVARFGIGRNDAELAWMIDVVSRLRAAFAEERPIRPVIDPTAPPSAPVG